MRILGKKKTVIYVDYHEVEDLIKEEYGLAKRFSLVVSEEASNDSVMDFNVSSVAELDEWEAEKLEKLKSGGSPGGVAHAALQDMVNRGVIEAGTYVVEICW